MGYFGRLFDAIKEYISENFLFLKNVYEKDVVLFTAFILIFVPLGVMLVLSFAFVIVILFFRQLIMPPDPVLNLESFMPFLVLFVFLPMIFGVFILQAKRDSQSRKPLKQTKKTPPTTVEGKQQKLVNSVAYREKNLESYSLSQDDFNLIVKHLEDKKVKSICPMCGCDDLLLAKFFGFSRYYIRINDFVETDDGIPTIKIACKRCGYIMEHALPALDLKDIKKISDEIDQTAGDNV